MRPPGRRCNTRPADLREAQLEANRIQITVVGLPEVWSNQLVAPLEWKIMLAMNTLTTDDRPRGT